MRDASTMHANWSNFGKSVCRPFSDSINPVVIPALANYTKLYRNYLC